MNDPAITDPAMKDPAMKDPAMKDPAMKDPAMKDPAIKDLATADPPDSSGRESAVSRDHPNAGSAAGPSENAPAGREPGLNSEQRKPVPIPKERACLWCRTVFALMRRPGRQRIYCSQSCRQRAYERRRGLGVFPPPERLITQPGGPLAHLPNRFRTYEAGGMHFTTGLKVHALRPAGYAEAGERRATLCGLKRRPSGRPFVFGPKRSTCQTCVKIAEMRPPARRTFPSSDLAAYRAQLDAVGMRLAEYGIDNPLIRPDVTARLLFELLAAA